MQESQLLLKMKVIEMNLEMIEKKSKSKEKIKCLVTDGKMVTKYSNQNRAMMAYQGLRKQTEPFYGIKYTRGVLFETFQDKTAEEIAETAEKQMLAVQEETTAKGNKQGQKMKYKFTKEEREK